MKFSRKLLIALTIATMATVYFGGWGWLVVMLHQWDSTAGLLGTLFFVVFTAVMLSQMGDKK
jgi:biotin transporter BioY